MTSPEVPSLPPKQTTGGERRAFVGPIIDFFSAETNGAPAALFRIGLGLLGLGHATGVLLNVERYFGETGLMPFQFAETFPENVVSVVALAPTNSTYVAGLGILLLGSALGLLLGIYPRACALGVYVISVGFMHRNPYILNSGDHLYLLCAALGALMPLGRRWSIEAWLRKRKATTAARDVPYVWSQRLVALQIAYVYLYAFSAKVGKRPWHDGQAIFDSLSSPALATWPTAITFTPLLIASAWGTLLFEALFPVLVFDRRIRRYCLLAGVVFHGVIGIVLRVPMFSGVMIVSYACFLEDEEAERLVQKAFALFGRAKAAANLTEHDESGEGTS